MGTDMTRGKDDGYAFK